MLEPFSCHERRPVATSLIVVGWCGGGHTDMARQLLVRLAFMPTRDRQDCQTQEEHVRNVLASFPPVFSLFSADSLSCAAQRWSKGCGGELTQIGSTRSWLPASRASLAACTAGGRVGTGFCDRKGRKLASVELLQEAHRSQPVPALCKTPDRSQNSLV